MEIILRKYQYFIRFHELFLKLKERNAVAMAALASGQGNGSNMPNPAASSSDIEKESGGKLASLPPAKLDLGGLKISKIATGLQHTLLLSKTGEVYAFGSNNNGQLGLLDFHPRGVPTQVKLPVKATSIACGSYHSVILAEDGRVFTFGNYQKGSLGREGPPEDAQAAALTREEMAVRKLWFTIPDAIPGNVSAFSCFVYIAYSTLLDLFVYFLL